MITDILKQRGKTYGDHKAMYSLVWKLWEEIINTAEFKKLKPWQKVEVCMILFKTGRGISSPDHKDHWDDIGGYAQLVADNDPSQQE